MPKLRHASLPACALVSAVLVAGPAAASQHIYSYDSANLAAERMTQAGLSFVFDKRVVGITVRRILETQNIGAADLKPVSESVLGKGGVTGILGEEAAERDLYEITDKEDGKALGNALCPGSDHVWLAFGRLKMGQDLRIRALGHDPGAGKTRLCQTLDYTYRGEWALPLPILPQPDRTDRFNDAPNRLPY